jgi:N-acetylglucosamine malate deacetylase 1
MTDILIFGAHPDDIEFGMGGTLLKLRKKHAVALVVFSRGEMGTYGTPEIREQEMKNAAKFARCELEILDYGDTKIMNDDTTRMHIAKIIRKYAPKTIFVPYHTNPYSHRDGVAHFDHSTTGKIITEAARLAKFKTIKMDYEAHLVQNIIYYMVPKYVRPSFVVDISDVYDDWLMLIQCHKSQMDIRDGKIKEVLTTYRRIAGIHIGTQYAESFLMEEPIKLDVDSLIRV